MGSWEVPRQRIQRPSQLCLVSSVCDLNKASVFLPVHGSSHSLSQSSEGDLSWDVPRDEQFSAAPQGPIEMSEDITVLSPVPWSFGPVGRGQWDGLLAAASGASACWTLSSGVVWKYRSEGGDGGQGSCAVGLLSVPPSSGWWLRCELRCLLRISEGSF